MNFNRTVVFVVCLFYLSALFFLIGAMSDTITGIDAESTTATLNPSINFLGYEIGYDDSILGNIIISISILPLWMNTIFIIIPATLMIVFGIMMFIPTIPSG